VSLNDGGASPSRMRAEQGPLQSELLSKGHLRLGDKHKFTAGEESEAAMDKVGFQRGIHVRKIWLRNKADRFARRLHGDVSSPIQEEGTNNKYSEPRLLSTRFRDAD
jgi:hypothetical protein